MIRWLLQDDSSYQDSDAEFEQMLAEAEHIVKMEGMGEGSSRSGKRKGKAAIKKSKKKKKSSSQDGYETDHQVLSIIIYYDNLSGTVHNNLLW